MTAPTIRAQYRGTCTECPAPIEPGQDIVRQTGEHDTTYRHAACPDDPDLRADRGAMRHPVCPRCTTRHPGDC